MSNFANPDKARDWLDGDAFRAPVGTAAPADIFASTLTGWSAFGGIKAGFVVTTDREVADIDIFNNTSGAPYKRRKKPPSVSVKFRAVDYSAATILTLLRGGSITAGMGGFEMVDGDDEEFALIFRVVDGADKKAYYVAKGELLTIPEETMDDAEDVEGFDFEIGPLAPGDGTKAIRRILSSNPLA